MTKDEILDALTRADASALFEEARRVRQTTKGQGVFLRGLIELSSVCERDCLYCGMRRSNPKTIRYSLSDDEILASAKLAQQYHFGTVVLQAGECVGLWTQTRVAELVRRIKGETGQKVTLSLGERTEADYAAWRAAGADRYLLRFETTDRNLFTRIHPGNYTSDEHPRLACLHILKALGYEVGSGMMLGLPGQTLASVVNDLVTIQDLQLDMVGLGPYLADPQTPLGQSKESCEVPVSVDFTCRCYAMVRLLLPQANIPSTTALSTLDAQQGRLRGLSSGANVFMPNLTPVKYRSGYRIYPDKICVSAPEMDEMQALLNDFTALGLTPVEA
ncbi:MAG: [FeFe] hydrogenase H-cluster radical SAM maturase HydE [bacterium]|nr:[FeFe] hydrogenase H-cluster radical SAM maturase HydE [bacterium]